MCASIVVCNYNVHNVNIDSTSANMQFAVT